MKMDYSLKRFGRRLRGMHVFPSGRKTLGEHSVGETHMSHLGVRHSDFSKTYGYIKWLRK